MQKEIWKDVPNYEGHYQVSNLGRVKSLSRKAFNGKSMHTLKGRILKGSSGKSNYLIVGLSKNGKRKTITIHQLVVMAFLNHKPNGYNGLIVDHVNNIKTDNRLNNLQLVTARHNLSKDRKNKTSKYTGVRWCNSSSKWRSAIYINGNQIHLGLFLSEKEASNTYQKAKKKLQKRENELREIKNKK